MTDAVITADPGEETEVENSEHAIDVLTAIPFSLVAARTLRPRQIFIVIGAAAITQSVVHLRYFLHVDLKPSSQNKVIALCFAAVVLLVLISGTLWIMFDLNYRMV